MTATALAYTTDAAPADPNPTTSADLVLDSLIDETIEIIREAAIFDNPVLLFSGGKDSAVLLHLARRAFAPGRMPFAMLHIDTGHNFPEVIAYRDRIVAETGERLIVASVQGSIDRGRVRERRSGESRNAMQAVTLTDTIGELKIDACLGGARRDEEKARAKERIFSHRSEFGRWDPRNQRPEPWGLFNTRLLPGENMRVFPISNWTETDVWRYIAREDLDLPTLYYAHSRPVFERDGMLFPVSALVQPGKSDTVTEMNVRFRTVGDMTCTCPVPSDAATPAEILTETATVNISERGATRIDDTRGAAAMEMRKKGGYF